MATSIVTVKNVRKLADDGYSWVKEDVDIVVDDEFCIDGIPMPAPHDVNVVAEMMTRNAERNTGNGEMEADYLGTAFNVTWTYKLINAAQFKYIYLNYIKTAIQNQNVWHTVKSMNTLDDDYIEITAYNQKSYGDFEHFMGEDNFLRYVNVVIELIDKAGVQ